MTNLFKYELYHLIAWYVEECPYGIILMGLQFTAFIWVYVSVIQWEFREWKKTLAPYCAKISRFIRRS